MLHSAATPCTRYGYKVHFMERQPDPTKCAGNHWLDVTAPREPEIKSLPACAHAKSPSPLNRFSFISRSLSVCTVLFCSSMYLCKSLGHGACAVRAWACLHCLSSAHRAGSQLQGIALFVPVVSARVSSEYLATRIRGHTVVAFELFCIFASSMQNNLYPSSLQRPPPLSLCSHSGCICIFCNLWDSDVGNCLHLHLLSFHVPLQVICLEDV